MDKVFKKYIRQIAEYLIKEPLGNRIKLTQHVEDKLEDIICRLKLEYDTDELWDEIVDLESDGYKELIREIKKAIEKAGNLATVYLDTQGIYEYLVPTLYGINDSTIRNKIEEQFKKLSLKDINVKGDCFEKFCCKFLEDIGCKKVTKTGKRNDKGIDIVAEYLLDKSPKIGIFCSEVFILGQVKYYEAQVTQDVIRNFMGDSLLIRLKESKLYNISYHPVVHIVFSNIGFSGAALKYAKENGIYTLCVTDLVNIICTFKKVEELESVKYILNAVV